MRRPHLLRVERGAGVFAPLVEAVHDGGLRVGWLDLEAPAAAPPELAEAAGLPLLRAVAAAGDATVAVKGLRGAPVLDDLLREHFLGCALVLVRGAVEAPLLEPAERGWRVGGESLGTEELARRLGRPGAR